MTEYTASRACPIIHSFPTPGHLTPPDTCHSYLFLSPCILIPHKPLLLSFEHLFICIHIMSLSYMYSFLFLVTLHTGLSAQIAIDHACIAQEIKFSQGLLFLFV